MTDADCIEALLDLADPERTADPERVSRLVVLGLAERHRNGFRPTSAGWVVMGDRGRAFDV